MCFDVGSVLAWQLGNFALTNLMTRDPKMPDNLLSHCVLTSTYILAEMCMDICIEKVLAGASTC